MSQQISHLLKAESHTNGSRVFSFPADASTTNRHVRFQQTPLMPYNFTMITREVISI